MRVPAIRRLTTRRTLNLIAPIKSKRRSSAVIRAHRPHYQHDNKPGHTFYDAIPGAGLGIVGRKTGVPLLGDVIDFFIPLSDLSGRDQSGPGMVTMTPEQRLVRVGSDSAIRPHMTKCKVRLNGEAFEAEIASGQDNRPVTVTGFFTTKFVQATTKQDAVNRAIKLVEEELTLRPECRRLRQSKIVEVAVAEDPQGFDEYAPGGGFTWD